MQPDDPGQAPLPAPSRATDRTRWSLIAALHGDRRGSLAARDALARQYAYPVYAYLRRNGHPAPAAFTLALGFIAAVIARLRRDPPASGTRFRRFLIAQLQEFLASGTPAPVAEVAVSWSQEELERRLAATSGSLGDPMAAFDRDCADELMARALQRLGAEALQGGHQPLFDRLLPLLAADAAPGRLDEIAREIGVPALAAAVALKRLRQRFRELIDDELGRTVDDEQALREERRALFQAAVAKTS